jgi:predicted DNA-binding transcriptional regulator YafY
MRDNVQNMTNPSARLLQLLNQLHSRTRWSGPELATRMGISARTLRYDIAKLRDLGYEVQSLTGVVGGYALQAGSSLPPLLLEDDEAVAMAIGLRLAAGGTAGVGEAAVTALAKLEQVLPWRLRGRMSTLRNFTETVDRNGPGTEPADVVFLTGACRDQRRVRFDYADRHGNESERDVEPYRLVQTGGRWYLLAFDPQRADWRHFRLDRMTVKQPAGARFRPQAAPPSQALVGTFDAMYRRHWADAVVAAPAQVVSARVPTVVPVEVVDASRCRVRATGDTADTVAANLLLIGQDFVVEDASPDVLDALRVLARRVAAALEHTADNGPRPTS